MATEFLTFGLLLIIVGLVAVLVTKRRRANENAFDEPHASPTTGLALSGGLALAEQPPNEIILGPAENPQIRLRLAEPADLSLRREPMRLPTPVRDGLAPLLQHLPRILVEGANLASNAQKVVLHFSPETWKGIADGSLELMNSANMGNAFRSVTRTTTGTRKIVEHGNITFEVSPVTAAVAIWQVAALITGQRFLSDIDARLANLERGIASIRGFLDDEVTAKLEGNFAYLRDRAETLTEGRFAPAELQSIGNQLEAIDRESRAAARHMMKQLARETEGIKSAKWDALWSADEEATHAREQVNRATQSANSFLVANHVRLVTASLRGAMGLNEAYTVRSLKSICEEVAKHDDEWLRLKSTVEAKLPNLKASLQRGDTDHKQQAGVADSLRSATDDRRVQLDQLLAATDELLSAVAANENARDLPMQVELEVNARGEVLNASRLLAS